MAASTEPQLVPAVQAAASLGLTTRELFSLVESGAIAASLAPIPGRRSRWVHIHRDELSRYRFSRGPQPGG